MDKRTFHWNHTVMANIRAAKALWPVSIGEENFITDLEITLTASTNDKPDAGVPEINDVQVAHLKAIIIDLGEALNTSSFDPHDILDMRGDTYEFYEPIYGEDVNEVDGFKRMTDFDVRPSITSDCCTHKLVCVTEVYVEPEYRGYDLGIYAIEHLRLHCCTGTSDLMVIDIHPAQFYRDEEGEYHADPEKTQALSLDDMTSNYNEALTRLATYFKRYGFETIMQPYCGGYMTYCPANRQPTLEQVLNITHRDDEAA